MKKTILFITLILLTLFSFSQNKKAGELVLKTGEKIDIYNKVLKNGKIRLSSYNGKTIYYFTKEGKSKSMNQSKVESMELSNGSYINLPIYVLKAERLHRIVAENDKYLLTDYYSTNRFQFYIFDKSTMKAKEKLKFQSYRPKKDIKLIKLVEEYFSECPRLIEKIQSNFDTFYNDKHYKKKMINMEPRSILFENISKFKCN